MKAILVIADGLGGRPTDTGGRTCLEAARTPHLDALAAGGALGLVDPIGPGVRPGSDTAHLSLLGYDPFTLYTGRGVFECLGIGLDVQAGDVCFRANFATVEARDAGLVVIDRRAGRIESGQDELAAALNKIRLEEVPGVSFQFRASTQHRGALLLRGESLSRYVTENDPHGAGELALRFEPEPGHEDEAALRTAAALNEFAERSHAALRDHPVNRRRVENGEPPANFVLARGAADCPNIPSIKSVYGVRGAVIAGGALYRGVALACGMTTIDVPGATGGLDTDLDAKARAAIDALDEFDYVFVHVKGADNAGHDQDAAAKTAFIERIDSELVGPLVERLDWNATHLAFTGDHTTPVDYGDHTVEPVPVLYVGPSVARDETTSYGEREAGRGGLGRFSGRVLPILLGYSNWAPKFGS
ncbi:MAG: 2,3-bisphosphoglycerate-independent phosphoglycerate mutase [Acidobacteriota bacterium]|nr:MAG: 2,3-bisphosphoglycerate-independent phosphoglycerate mutase [Acidobacteriota bacterium]